MTALESAARRAWEAWGAYAQWTLCGLCGAKAYCRRKRRDGKWVCVDCFDQR